MQRVSWGYTIVETLIFLAISSFILIVSLYFMNGKAANDRFAASVRDTQQQLQDWINNVSTGYPGGVDTQNVYCQLESGGNYVQIKDKTVDGGTPPSGPECVFLGRAIQFTDASYATPSQAQKIYSYNVFGRRNADDGTPAGTLDAAAPIPAVGRTTVSSGHANLTDTFTIPGTTRILSVSTKSTSIIGTPLLKPGTHLAAFYLSFNQLSGNQGGSTNTQSYLYNLKSGSPVPNNPSATAADTIGQCIAYTRFNTCGSPNILTEVDLCLADNPQSETAVISIISDDGNSAQTSFAYKACT